ncbi:hypothetical protein HBB16_06340 [Pseudonocardia sp. MCCB 268]|nr:hypothetical protein [Pseudonocardia cytotoxica]
MFNRLFEKIEEQRLALGGKVFDVLGEAFAGTPLRTLLLLRSSTATADIRAQLEKVIDDRSWGGHRPAGRRTCAAPNTLLPWLMSNGSAWRWREARARRLQPHRRVGLLPSRVHLRLGGRIAAREPGQAWDRSVSAELRDDRHLAGGRCWRATSA